MSIMIMKLTTDRTKKYFMKYLWISQKRMLINFHTFFTTYSREAVKEKSYND